MARDNRPDSVYLFGAICPERAAGAAVIMPSANTEAMNEHLQEISTQVAEGAPAVLVCDGAGGTVSPSLPPADRFAMAPTRQPFEGGGQHNLTVSATYTPELNPMENVWDYLRQYKLCATVWNTYEDIVEACKTAWHFLIDDPKRIRSIGTRDWVCVSH